MHLPYSPYPSQYGYPVRRGLGLPVPGIVGLALLACGALVIGATLAPEAVEKMVPGWRQQYGTIVTIGVILGLARSVLRTLMPLAAVGFWVAAAWCLVHRNLPLPNFLGQKTSTVVQQAPQLVPVTYTVPSGFTGRSSLGSALPDAAFFPAPRSSGSGSIFPASLKRAVKKYF